MNNELDYAKYGGPIGIGIAFMFMLTIEGLPHHPAPYLTYTIFGLAAGLGIALSYTASRRFLCRFRVFNEHILVRIIHSYITCTFSFALVAALMALLPWSFFPSLKIAFHTSLGVGIIAVMICFTFEYVAIKDERLRLEQENKELAVVEERNRIARELHDSVSQSLFGISLNLNTLELIMQEQPEKARALIKQVKEMVGEAQTEMRLMIYELQPVILQEKGFFEALETLCELFRTRYHLAITCLLSGDEAQVETQTQVSLYRVIQEALHNVVKHARATKVKITLNIQDKGSVSAVIEDNGQGFDKGQIKGNDHFGLVGMKERISALKGDFHLNSVIGKGTTITLQIPKQQ